MKVYARVGIATLMLVGGTSTTALASSTHGGTASVTLGDDEKTLHGIMEGAAARETYKFMARTMEPEVCNETLTFVRGNGLSCVRLTDRSGGSERYSCYFQMEEGKNGDVAAAAQDCVQSTALIGVRN